MRFNVVVTALLITASQGMSANVSIEVKADSGRIPISPSIYGRNGSGVSDNPQKATDDAMVFLTKEAGLGITRETGGNNQTRYNWRKKLTVHPDWYNNVYQHDWDYSANEMKTKLPGVQGMYGFQLLGWAASNTDHNFADYAYGQKHNAVPGQNLAGGGVPDSTGGGKALKEGDASLYCERWPADSSAAILRHWFGTGGLGLDTNKFRYWGMDNEVEIWNATHDDVDSLLTGHILTAEECVQSWAAVAKAARKLYPGIKLAGPASASPWQWYTWPTGSLIPYKGRSYCWPEYLIKRLAEIQDSSGVRMLDVYDVHFYLPGNTKEVIQQHFRLLWDTTYYGPNNDATRFADGGYNQSPQVHEMFFKRVNDWCDKYFGKGHGITVGATESGLDGAVSNYPSEVATWYASIIGTFADHGAAIFTPWNWHPGMWETVHLFARYAQADRVKSVSSYDSIVSAYSSISQNNDSLTVILVNRGPSAQTANVALSGFVPTGGGTSLRLAGLTGETFVSHTQNALQKGTVSVNGGKFTADLPGYSITAYVFSKKTTEVAPRSRPVGMKRSGNILELDGGPDAGYVDLRTPAGGVVGHVQWRGNRAQFDLSLLPRGLYVAGWVGGQVTVVVAAR